MENRLTMTGNLASDVGHWCGNNASGKWSKAEFRIAHTPRLRQPDGTWSDDTTTFLSVVVWGSLADHCRDSLHRGDPVLVEGRLRTDEWNDDKGEVRSKLVIQATSVGHDLTRGRSRFARSTAIPDPLSLVAETRVEEAAGPDVRTTPEDEEG